MMAIGSSILGHILTTHLPPPMSKNVYGALVHEEIYFKPNNSEETLPAQTTCPLALMDDTKVDVMDCEPKEDDIMDDDMTMDDGNTETVTTPVPKFKSTITCSTSHLGDGGPDNTKRRSFRKETSNTKSRNSKGPN
jgi:hypothetical protein